MTTTTTNWHDLARSAQRLSSAINLAVDNESGGRFLPEDADSIIAEFASTRKLMRQITDNEPRLEAVIARRENG